MTTKREQELLEANHRLLMRAREAEEKLLQAPEEAKKHLEAIAIIAKLRDHIGLLLHATELAGTSTEYEINSLLVSLAGKYERFVSLPTSNDEARTLISVGQFYLRGGSEGVDTEEGSIPVSEHILELREAFKAGWRTNAVSHETQPADYLDGCEQTDFEAYQDLGITIYLDQLQPIKEEFGETQTPESWAEKWAKKVDVLSQQPADTDTIVQVGKDTIYLDPTRRVRHVKRGTTYEVIGEAEGQIAVPELARRENGMLVPDARILVEGDKLTIYRAEEDGKLYWRVPEEFEDGRFETIRPDAEIQASNAQPSIPDTCQKNSKCPNMKEVGGGFEGERYRCDVCGASYFLDYEDMK